MSQTSDSMGNTDSLSKIEMLYLANLNLKELPQWVSYCKNLKEINLSGNKELDLYIVFEQLSYFENLKKVTIQRIGKKIPDNIYKLKKIEDLDLRSNELLCLPDSIRYCKLLTGIDLDDNRLSYEGIIKLCEALPNLGWLSLEKNNLYSLPVEICIPKLEYLDLYGNHIIGFPDCFYQSKTISTVHFTAMIADGIIVSPPIDLDMQSMRDRFRKEGRRVNIE